MAVVFGAAVILFDPIFQGLAISLMAGEVASLLISRLAVPVLYYQVHGRRSEDARHDPPTETTSTPPPEPSSEVPAGVTP